LVIALKTICTPLRKLFALPTVPRWQKEQPNAIYCKMMEHERWAIYCATCNTIECFSELLKMAQFYFNVVAHCANVERFFPRCSHKPKRKRNPSNWTSLYSIKAGVLFETSFMQLVS